MLARERVMPTQVGIHAFLPSRFCQPWMPTSVGMTEGAACNVDQTHFFWNNAKVIGDLGVPPNNRLEALKGDRAGQHSIRINQQWRICFVWTQGGPDHVEIVDYH